MKRIPLAVALIVLLCLLCLAQTAISQRDHQATGASEPGAAAEPESASEQSTDQPGLLLAKGILYKRTRTASGVVVHVVRVDTKAGAARVRPYISDSTEQTSAMASRLNAVVAVNGGYFNLSDGESASYVYLDGKQMCEPKHNAALVNNPGLRPFLPKIFNRSEIRFMKDRHDQDLTRIQAHEDALPRGFRLVDSLQAGPQLLPRLTAREEAFVRSNGNGKHADSIGTYLKAARTACGITEAGEIVIACVEGRRTKEFSEGLSLPDLADFMRRMGCLSAMNFDGGSSTTMVVKPPNGDTSFFATMPAGTVNASPAQGSSGLLTVFSAAPERRVKSILYVVPGPDK